VFASIAFGPERDPRAKEKGAAYNSKHRRTPKGQNGKKNSRGMVNYLVGSTKGGIGKTVSYMSYEVQLGGIPKPTPRRKHMI